MSLAAETRRAARASPFLLESMRASVVNYAAAARYLAVSEDTAAVAAALRRFAGSLPDRSPADRSVRVTMHAGLEPTTTEPLLRVGQHGFGGDDGDLTGVLATGEVDPSALRHAIGVLGTHGVDPVAAGVAADSLLLVVDRSDGPTTVQLLENALESVPNPTV